VSGPSASWPVGVRAVALFEAAKGLLVVGVGFGLLGGLHPSLQQLAESAVAHLHLNPASHYPRIFLEAAASVTLPGNGVLVLGAAAYVAVRFVEAWGLWFGLRWAQWFAALSGAVYVPFEVYELVTRGGGLAAAALLANLAVVAVVATPLVRRYRGRPT
jgi:uncharacterized membrane protein (DUF2068 family)